MRTSLRTLIREAVLCLLKEAKCPFCGTDGAYLGFNSVECPNPECSRFDPSQYQHATGRKWPLKKGLTFVTSRHPWLNGDREISFDTLKNILPDAWEALRSQCHDPESSNSEEEQEEWCLADVAIIVTPDGEIEHHGHPFEPEKWVPGEGWVEIPNRYDL